MELYLRTDIRNDAYKMDTYDAHGFIAEIQGEVPTPVRHEIYKFYSNIQPTPNPTPTP